MRSSNRLPSRIDLSSTGKTLCAGILLCSGLTLSSCGGSGGDSNPTSNLIPGESTATPADQLSTEQILQGAADTTSAGLGQRLSDFQQIADDAIVDMDPNNPANGVVDTADTSALSDLDSQNNDLLFSSLGVNDANADTTRTGNVITINPDEQAVCNNPTGAEQDTSTCLRVMVDVMVRVEAITEDSGQIVYLYQNNPLLSIGYAPNGVIYELEIGTLSSALQAAGSGVESGSSAVTTTAVGTVRLSALISSDQPENEAAELSLKIVDPLAITDNNSGQTLLSLQPSTVIQANVDAATDSITTMVDWGALQLVTESGDSEGNTSQQTLSLGGLTGQLMANEAGGPIELTNIGIGEVPLNIRIDSVESISLGLDTFGASLDPETNIITLTSAFGFQFIVDNLAGVINNLPEQYRLELSASAPSGTGFQEQKNGSTMVISGGPLTASSNATDATQSMQVDTTVQVGECFGELDETGDDTQTDTTDSSDPALQLVSCE